MHKRVKEIASVAIALIILVILATLTGCKTSEITKEHTTSYKETYRDSLVKLPGERVSTDLDSSTLALILQALKSGKKEVVIPSRSGDLMQKFYLDEFGRLKADCEQKDKYYNALIKQITQTDETKQSTEKTKSEMPWWGWVIIGAVGIIAFIVKPFNK